MSLVTRVGLSQRTPVSSFILKASFARGIKTIPQPPGNIVGTVNDAYVPPKAHKTHGSWHWTSERLVAVGLIPLVATSFTSTTSVMLDTTLSAFLLFHCYTGFQACIIDYIPQRVYGSMHSFVMYLLTFGTGVAGYGIYDIEQKEEGGLAGIIAKIWHA